MKLLNLMTLKNFNLFIIVFLSISIIYFLIFSNETFLILGTFVSTYLLIYDTIITYYININPYNLAD